MKRSLLVLISLLHTYSTIAQAFPAGSYWRYRDELHDRVTYKTEFMYLITEQQQVVAGRMSNRLIWRSSESYNDFAQTPDKPVGWYAEDNNIGYLLTDYGMIKLFDYNKQVGETMPFGSIALGGTPLQEGAVISSIGTKNIDGVLRRVFVLGNEGMEMIENVGLRTSSLFKLSPTSGDYNISTPEFVCFNDGNGLTYAASPGASCIYMMPTLWPLSVVGVEENASSLYPNPCNDVLHIQAPDATTAHVYDMLGRLVATTDAPTINTGAWRSGLYVVKLYNADMTLVKTERVVKQ